MRAHAVHRMVAGYLILLAVMVVATAVQGYKAQQALTLAQHNEQHLATGAYRFCVSGNDERQSTNRAHITLRAALQAAATVERRLGGAGEGRASIRRSAAQSFTDAADALQYLPLIDCTQFASHPRTYKLPVARPFTDGTH
jgi:hypothetical protein